MGHVVVAPIGDNIQALFVGMKEFPTEKAILITPKKYVKDAEKVKRQLSEFTIPADIIEIEGNIMEEMFRTFRSICAAYDPDKLLVNIASGDRISTCAALSAAFANGIKAVGVMDGKAMLLPIMRLSYYHELTENKLRLLKALEGKGFVSLQDLSKKVNMSISLLSYHINGNYHSKGLRGFNLVDVREEKKSLLISLNPVGNLLARGYLR